MTRQCTAPIRMIPMALVMGTIYYLSDKPGDSLHLPALPGIDKLAHLLAYAVLASATLFAFDERWRAEKGGLVVCITLSVCLVYGISDEFHQSFIPGREPSILDILADVSGGVLVCLLWLRLRGKKRTILRSK